MAEIIASGECGAEGDNVTWTFDSDGILTLSGAGETVSFESLTEAADNRPFSGFVEKNVCSIVIQEGITSIGSYLLPKEWYGGIRSVYIAESVTAVGDGSLCAYVPLVKEYTFAHYLLTVYYSGTKGQWENIDMPPLAHTAYKREIYLDYNSKWVPSGLSSVSGEKNVIRFTVGLDDALYNRGPVLGTGGFRFSSTDGASVCINVIDSTMNRPVSASSNVGVERSFAFYFKNGGELEHYTSEDGESHSFYNYFFSAYGQIKGVGIPDGSYPFFQKPSGADNFNIAGILEILLADSVTQIEKNAFSGETFLKKIRLSNSVTSIGDGAFYGCDALETVQFYGTQEEFETIEIGEGNEAFTNAPVTFITPHTVTFDSGGGTEVEAQTVEYEDSAVAPPDPEKYKNLFQYWALNGEPYSFRTPVTEDITLVAVWEEWKPVPTDIYCGISNSEPLVSVSFSFSQPVDEGIAIDWGDGESTIARYENASAVSSFTRDETGNPVGTWQHQYKGASHYSIKIIPSFESVIVLCGDYTDDRTCVAFSGSG